MKKILIIKLLLLSVAMYSQELFYKSYDWDSNPKYKIESTEKNKEAVVLKDKTVSEFAFEGEGVTEYYLTHKVFWLNSDEQIERFNKMYFPVFRGGTVLENKARVITPEGKVINLDKSKINKATNEETGAEVIYYAFEGVTKGSFIESYYLVRKYPKYDGKRVFVQGSLYKRNVEFDLYAPKNLIFAFKSFNNAPEVVHDTVVKDKERWTLKAKNIEELQKEKSSPYNALRSYVAYKADKNLNNGVTGISSYSKIAKNLHSFHYKEFSKKEKRLLAKLLKELKINELNTDDEKIRAIDAYIKTEIFAPEVYDKKLQELEHIISKKVANFTGILRLYISLFREANIKHEIVLTSNRYDIKFDKKFEADCFTTDFLIYFPTTKKYLSPDDKGSRYGFPPEEYTCNYGLFIKEVKLGDFSSAVGKVKYIKPVDISQNIDKMDIDVSFDKDDLTKNTVKLKEEISGYPAMPIQAFIHLIKDKEELIKSFAQRLDKDITLTSKSLKNDDIKSVGVKPLVFDIELTSEAFTDKAGKNYLFKLGMLIGKQIEMYQEKKRKLPYEDSYRRSYYRTINVTIPDGYTISNLKDINIHNSYSKDGKLLFEFRSFYELSGNILKITADEHYYENIVPVAIFEEYRKVINSAADFNKITLVLKPKG